MTAMMSLAEVAHWLPGAKVLGDNAVVVGRVHTDTRTLQPGDLFVALKGERFDANTFLAQAEQSGAAAALCHSGADRSGLKSMVCIEVPDTKLALGQLAAGWREQFNLPVIAVTGSNGKTTVTQMIAAILEAYRPHGAALATQGNFNNDIGVPLTLLRLRKVHQVAVVELGMNHPGEIATLASMVKPTVALVNNAQREHLEFMQTVRAVALENGSVITPMGLQGVVVYPRDDDHAEVWRILSGSRAQVTFAMDGTPDQQTLVCTKAEWSDGAWHVAAQGMGHALSYRLAIAGRHNVKNSLAAAASALSAGVPAQAVVQGLEAFSPVKGRSKALALAVQGREVTLVDDTYNANPDSVHAAIDVLAELPGPRVLVLGDMGEVGHQGPHFHAEAGRYAKAKGIEELFTLGTLAQVAAGAFQGARHFGSVQALNDALLAELPHLRSVVVKGSRFMRMEQVVEAALASANIHREPRRGS